MILNAIFMFVAVLLFAASWGVFESSIKKAEYNAGAMLLFYAGTVFLVIGLMV